MKAYQYSLLRYRRSKSAGELVNIGLIMAVSETEDVFHFISPRYGRLSKFFGEFDGKGYKRMVEDLRRHFSEVLRPEEGGDEGETSRQLRLGETIVTRSFDEPGLDDLRPKLVPEPDSCFQWSDTMSGVHPAPEERFRELCHEFILRHEPGSTKRDRRDESKIQSAMTEFLARSEYRDLLKFGERLRGRHDVEHEFLVAWENGTVQVADALSFDYLDRQGIQKKANRWCGTLHNLAENGEDFEFTGVVAPPPKEELFDAFDNACKLVDDMDQTRDLIEENHLEQLERELEADLAG